MHRMNTDINLNIDMETTEDWTGDEASRARMRLKELELLDVVYRGDVDQVRKLLEDCVNLDALDE